jgi:deoxyribodipyrimidine photo-lyase
MQRALRSLDDSIDGALVYRNGDPVDVVPRFAAEVGADSVFVTATTGHTEGVVTPSVPHDFGQMDEASPGHGSPYVIPPGSVMKDDGRPPRCSRRS